MKDRNNYFLVSILILCFLGIVYLLFEFLPALFFGVLITSIFHPLYVKILKFIESHDNKGYIGKKIYEYRRQVSSLLIIFTTIFLILPPFSFIGSMFLKQGTNIYKYVSDKLPEIKKEVIIKTLNYYISKLPGNFKINPNTFVENLKKYIFPTTKAINFSINFGINSIKHIFENIINLIINVLVMVLTIFFLLQNGKEFGEYIIDLSPLKTEDEIKIFNTFKDIGKGIIIGNTVSAVAQGMLAGLGFLFLGVNNPVFYGVVAMFFAFIPFLGPLVVCIPASIYLLIIGKTVNALFLFFYSIFIVSSIDNIIKPYFIGEHSFIHPFLIFLSIIGGLKTFGMMGIFYGPLIISIFATLAEIYMNKRV